MINLAVHAKELQETLPLKWLPISVTFTKDPPAGIRRIDQRAPSGCTYWRLAAEGKIFYTEASDHYGCPIGAYTHGVELPPEQSKELEGLIDTMVGLNYLKMEEVPAIARRDVPFRFAIYAPPTDSPFEPDVVIVRGNPKQMMLLAEAAIAAGISASAGIVSRPTCSVVPAVMKSGQYVMSLACIGNRVYNDLSDDELYSAFRASQFRDVIEKMKSIFRANHELEAVHQARKSPHD
jgi:uncharacterized protein (DUF169 family)